MDVLRNLDPLLVSGSVLEVKALLRLWEAALRPTDLCGPSYRSMLRLVATKPANYGNMAVVRYFCEERGVPVNFLGRLSM